jgi:hypothetical protein
MVNAVEEKGKVRVLTSAKAKRDGSVDPARQVTFEQVHKGEQEKERYQKYKYEEEKRRYEEEYMREQECAHWGCAFFRHCWNEGLKLPTQNNFPDAATSIPNIGKTLPIADPSMKELKGCILVMVGV